MKKIVIILGTILFTLAILTSCGDSSIERDAKKVAELQCKAQKLLEKATNGDTSAMEEYTDLANKATDIAEEMEGKYTSDSDQQKFEEAFLKEMGNCK